MDENVRYFNSIFMDIDDVNGMDFSSMTTAQMREWLMKTYELPEEMLPEISVSSGHGLHLYYLVDELDMLKLESAPEDFLPEEGDGAQKEVTGNAGMDT